MEILPLCPQGPQLQAGQGVARGFGHTHRLLSFLFQSFSVCLFSLAVFQLEYFSYV